MFIFSLFQHLIVVLWIFVLAFQEVNMMQQPGKRHWLFNNMIGCWRKMNGSGEILLILYRNGVRPHTKIEYLHSTYYSQVGSNSDFSQTWKRYSWKHNIQLSCVSHPCMLRALCRTFEGMMVIFERPTSQYWWEGGAQVCNLLDYGMHQPAHICNEPQGWTEYVKR